MKNEQIKNYLLENEDILLDVVNELNSWNGIFEEFINYDIEECFELFFNDKNAIEGARAVFFGNVENWSEPVRFNGYGNIETYSDDEKMQDIKNDIDNVIDELIENYNNISIYDNELVELLEA